MGSQVMLRDGLLAMFTVQDASTFIADDAQSFVRSDIIVSNWLITKRTNDSFVDLLVVLGFKFSNELRNI
jgi:hypothetical protein